jgi:hypothetical protein
MNAKGTPVTNEETHDAFEGLVAKMETLRARCVCGTPPIPAVEKVATQLGFTYEEAYDYVLVIGCAYALNDPGPQG